VSSFILRMFVNRCDSIHTKTGIYMLGLFINHLDHSRLLV